MTTVHPTALADQFHAASVHASGILRGLAAARPGMRLTESPPPRGWLAVHITALARALTEGTGRCCTHLGTGPRVVYAAVWAPGILVCPRCTPHLMPAPDEEHICDRCRRHSRRIYSGVAAVGPVILAYGLCRCCHATHHIR